jgi:predicted esterase
MRSAEFETVTAPFTQPVPALARSGPSPEAPLVVLCHGQGEDPDRALAAWPRTAALPAHVLAPAGPLPFEIRTGDRFRIGRAWYLYDGGDRLFRETVTASAAWLNELVRRVEAERGWRPRGRALVGFSQGAYFGYVAALSSPGVFDRLVAAAGRLKEEFVAEALARPGPLRTLILHGETDRWVSVEGAHRSHRALRRAGYEAELALFPGGHDLGSDQDRRAAGWLASGWGLAGDAAGEPDPGEK